MAGSVYDILRQLFNGLELELPSTETSRFLKQTVFLKSYNSVFYVVISQSENEPVLRGYLSQAAIFVLPLDDL